MIPGSKSAEGSTTRLIELCTGYFFFYVITGIVVKYFQGSTALGFPGLNDFEYLAYSTLGANATCLSVVLAKRWYRLRSTDRIQIFGRSISREYLYILPSGVCTAVVIPATTLMYSLPISVMVAMVMMRGAVIVISRLVDALQIRQGILQKKVHWAENVAVVFALFAVSVHLFGDSGHVGFEFFDSPAALGILGSYIVAYFIRIYIMNYYKNTRPKGAPSQNEMFFGVEQVAASFTMISATLFFAFVPNWFGWNVPQLQEFRTAVLHPHPVWWQAALASTSFGMVAFFSVFIFMFQGRTATFAGLVNRLTSLLAGTASTLLVFVFFGGKLPSSADWASLGFILVAVAFLTAAERRQSKEIAQIPKS
jgi:hypothetical protein